MGRLRKLSEAFIDRGKLGTPHLGTLIAGHDYASGNIESGLPYGVVEAVNEFCNTHDWRLAYLTNEARRYLSFAITHTTA